MAEIKNKSKMELEDEEEEEDVDIAITVNKKSAPKISLLSKPPRSKQAKKSNNSNNSSNANQKTSFATVKPSNKKTKTENLMWVEKYRPSDLQGIISHSNILETSFVVLSDNNNIFPLFLLFCSFYFPNK